MKVNKAAVALASALVGASPVWGFEFNDIQNWTGDGTNRIAFVVDWGGTAKAWGYRWNGDAPMLGTVIREIVEQDDRLKMVSSESQYGIYMQRFGYDVDANGSVDDAEPDQNEYSVYNPDSPYAVWGEEYAYDYYCWNLLLWPVADVYPLQSPEWAQVGADSVEVENGAWYTVYFGLYGTSGFSDPTAAAETPFRFKDIRMWLGSGTNEVALVVDWGGAAKAWGYRWNGEAPSVGQIIRAVVARDARLSMIDDVSSQYGLYVKRFSYDADDNGTVDEGEPDEDEYRVYNPNSPYAAWGEEYAYDYYSWNMLQGPMAETYSTNSPEWTLGADSVIAEDKTWYMIAFGLYGNVTLTRPTAALVASSATDFVQVGKTMYADMPAAMAAAKGGKNILLNESFVQSIAGRSITLGNGTENETFDFPDYYDLAVTTVNGIVSLSATLDADKVRPTLTAGGEGNVQPFTLADGKVTIVPGNVIDGLFYGLSETTSLDAAFLDPVTWVKAENGTVTLEAPVRGTECFFKVRVSDVDENLVK